MVVFTDALLTGWGGGICLSNSIGGEWPVQPVTSHKCVGALQGAEGSSHLVHGRHILIRADSASVSAYVNRQGGLRSSALHRAVAVGSSEPVKSESFAHHWRPEC